jgi:hypothetical protein
MLASMPRIYDRVFAQGKGTTLTDQWVSALSGSVAGRGSVSDGAVTTDDHARDRQNRVITGADMSDPIALGAVTSGQLVTPPPPPADPPVLSHATRQLDKATLVPLSVPAPSTGQATLKAGFVRQLGLQPGEVDQVRRGLTDASRSALSESVLALLADPASGTSEFVGVPAEALHAFGRALIDTRSQQVEQLSDQATPAEVGVARQAVHTAVLAVKGLAVNTAASPLGLLNLERLEMAPAGIERGGLLATIPLAPLEQTAVTQTEWSVQKKEFSSIVTDSLETVSETGVTDNTELAQSATSQLQHSNQFNITGTVQGGIPLISGSASSGFTGQDSSSQSATDSRKHATTLTQKASTRAKQEHKVTITTTTVTGTSQSTTRTVKNPSDTDAMRIDYFSLMRKWRVRLYRYGLRLTYDLMVPEPAAAMRESYAELADLKDRLGPFVFPVSHADITTEVRADDPPLPVTTPPTPPRPHYVVLADRYNAQVPLPPQVSTPLTMQVDASSVQSGTRASAKATINVPAGNQITSVVITGRMTSTKDLKGQFTVEGTTIPFDPWDFREFHAETLISLNGGNFLAGSTGTQTVLMTFDDVATTSLELTVNFATTADAYRQWQFDVWNALFNAAQTQYYAEQQDVAGRVTALQERLDGVDTLTLRREESDEIMKGVLRFLLGDTFTFMPPDVLTAFAAANVDVKHGIGFDGNALGLDAAKWATVNQHESVVRFINQAIEWENVVTFLYSYFWDVPDSWAFIRDIQHPDADRQAFLRAGSARVVLTVRKGWERRWVNFVETGVIDDDDDNATAHPVYLSIAKEIAAYDDRNYPGIPPANPGKTAARLEDSVYTTSNVKVGPSTTPAAIPVDSSDGFVVGSTVVIDSVDDLDHVQEAQVITRVPDGRHIEVARLANAHDGTRGAFPIVQPGEKGALIAEWSEYTPTSGTDIAITSNLTTIA